MRRLVPHLLFYSTAGPNSSCHPQDAFADEAILAKKDADQQHKRNIWYSEQQANNHEVRVFKSKISIAECAVGVRFVLLELGVGTGIKFLLVLHGPNLSFYR